MLIQLNGSTPTSPSVTDAHPSVSAGTSGASASATPSGITASKTTTSPAKPSAGSPSAARRYGVPERTELRTHNGDLVVDKAGTVVSGLLVKGAIIVKADNVTIRASRITPNTGYWAVQQLPGVNGLTVEQSEIAADRSAKIQYGIHDGGSGMVVRGCDISNVEVAVNVGLDAWVTQSFIHDLTPTDSTRGVYAGGGNKRLRVENNVILNHTREGSAIALYTDYGQQTNVTISGNLLAGGGYTIYSGGTDSRNIVVLGNTFSRRYFPNSGRYGPVDQWRPNAPGNQWQNNTWEGGGTVNPPTR
jgi:hypothetical protein